MSRKKEKIRCNNVTCGKEIEKDSSEVKRNKKLGRKNYCSRKCSAQVNGKYAMEMALKKRLELGITGIRTTDEFSPFREYYRRCKRRRKLGNLTLQDIKEQWEYQKGICPYTDIKLEFKTNDKFKLASLDRIDSSNLYEKGNIEFVSMPINLMKNTMSVEETIEFCKIIGKKW